MLSRRDLLALLGASAGFRQSAFAQGVATRGVKAQPRGKPSDIPFNARFVDVAQSAGLRAPVIYGPLDHKDYILETIGCGCAFFDYDNDGWLDALVLCGTRVIDPPDSGSNAASNAATNRLYKNNRDGTFTDVTEKAGLRRTGWASAVCVGDFDNDGFEDLFITYWGQNVLYRNNGDGTFSDITKQAGLLSPRTRWGAGCTWVDYDRDGHLDLFVSNYLEFDFAHAQKPGENVNCTYKDIPVNCGPRGLPPGTHSLYHNNGDGTFTDVSVKAGVSKVKGTYGMTVVAADFDEDGWPDIYVACDSTNSLLFMNNHDGTFREEGVERGAALSDDGVEQAGMGVGIGDFNLDGHLDIFKTHFSEDTNVLYRNDGKGNFSDVTLAAGLGVETRFTGWGAGVVDLDNDGYPDLFAVTGSVYPELEAKLPNLPFKTPRVIFRNLGGGTHDNTNGNIRFEELIESVGPGIDTPHASRGCAFGDFDNDGDLDILIVNLNEPPSLLRNDVSGSNHWLKVMLIGTKSNRSAIGARVIARYGGKQQAQEVLSQSSFYSTSDRRLHFGLGSARKVDLEVRWPNSMTQKFQGLDCDQLIVIHENLLKIEHTPWPGR